MMRSSSRETRCGISGRGGQDMSVFEDSLNAIDWQIVQREQTIRFLEQQIQAWSDHPSASTWSKPQADS